MTLVFKNNATGETVSTEISVGFEEPEWTSIPDAPEDYDPAKVNYLVIEGAFVASEAAALATMRARRKVLLDASDFIEFSRRLTTEQRTEGLAYRDALFDLPDTTDPFAPEWPTPPEWLNLPG